MHLVIMSDKEAKTLYLGVAGFNSASPMGQAPSIYSFRISGIRVLRHWADIENIKDLAIDDYKPKLRYFGDSLYSKFMKNLQSVVFIFE